MTNPLEYELMQPKVDNDFPELHFLKMGLPAEAGKKYLESVNNHIKAVKEAGETLNVPAGQLEMHDDSKFLYDEFRPYALHFAGGNGPRFDLFARAFHLHVHRNPHHWQYWVAYPDWANDPPEEANIKKGCHVMPLNYVREMVADWMGASIVYSGTPKMDYWLETNLPKLKLHPETHNYLRNILIDLGYSEVIQALHLRKEF